MVYGDPMPVSPCRCGDGLVGRHNYDDITRTWRHSPGCSNHNRDTEAIDPEIPATERSVLDAT